MSEFPSQYPPRFSPAEPETPPESPKRSTVRRVLIAVIVVLALLALVALGVRAVISRLSAQPRELFDAANTYVGAMEAGNPDAAYGQLCGQAKTAFRPEDWRRAHAASPRPRGHSFGGFTLSYNSNTGQRGQVTGTVDMDDGPVFVAINMAREGEAWTICGVVVPPRGPGQPTAAQAHTVLTSLWM